MTEQHPITPPPELMMQWSETWHKAQVKHVSHVEFVAIEATRWAAEQQHEISRDFLHSRGFNSIFLEDFDASCLNKPPSQKEQALEALGRIDGYAVSQLKAYAIHDELVEDVNLLRQLLEGLNND
jgi:hypothetical protein